MSFFASQLRVRLRFPLPSFICDISCEFQVPLNQLEPNSIHILVAFIVVFQYNNLIPTFKVFSQCFQLKRAEPGVFHLAPRRDDIMFSKHLRDEHRAATTPPATRFLKGTPSFSD
ncbi:UNVERIFIED_CONTAM: hypothetical protein Sangu_1857300 [Sesamum angustifolium]|uniref:Transposase (putative) gypsy type domain-containing protein n=1 Tax=Sesamum angustifolium TaxID=2727405 RepID=A0AAW2M9P6_9LAMI